MNISNLPHVKFINTVLLLFLPMVFVLTSCDLDDNDDVFEGQFQSYNLAAVDGSNVSGVATFDEREDGSTLVTIELSGTQSGAEHPAHIHANTVAEGGGIDVSLNPVDGATGRSETVVSSLDDGTSITFQDLIQYDGHINVHLSEDELETLIAEGDIGGNTLTGESISYDLNEVNGSGVSGTILLEERNNENTLATIQLTGTEPGGNHPAHIHNNSVAEGGDIAVPFNNVDGETGTSITNIRADQAAGGNLTYSGLLDFNGHVNVHVSDEDLAVIAEGDIGANFGGDTANGNANGNGDY